MYLAVAEDGGEARREIVDGLNRLYGFFGLRDIAAVAVAGTPADCVEGLQAVADAGADLILLNPMARERDQMEVLTTEVIPHVRGRRDRSGQEIAAPEGQFRDQNGWVRWQCRGMAAAVRGGGGRSGGP